MLRNITNVMAMYSSSQFWYGITAEITVHTRASLHSDVLDVDL